MSSQTSEEMRISVMEALRILDNLPEWHYDCVTAIAAHMFHVPISAISYVGQTRVWFRSTSGIEIDELPREVTFCNYTVSQNDPFVVEDATKDDRFRDNPLVTGELGLKFYAGCPIFVDGERVGALCVTDRRAQSVSADDRAALALLANVASALMQSEVQIRGLQLQVQELQARLEERDAA